MEKGVRWTKALWLLFIFPLWLSHHIAHEMGVYQGMDLRQREDVLRMATVVYEAAKSGQYDTIETSRLADKDTVNKLRQHEAIGGRVTSFRFVRMDSNGNKAELLFKVTRVKGEYDEVLYEARGQGFIDHDVFEMSDPALKHE